MTIHKALPPCDQLKSPLFNAITDRMPSCKHCRLPMPQPSTDHRAPQPLHLARLSLLRPKKRPGPASVVKSRWLDTKTICDNSSTCRLIQHHSYGARPPC